MASVKLCSVGVKKKMGSIALAWALVLNAVKASQKMGKNISAATR